MPHKPISSPSTDVSNRRRGTLCQIAEFPKPSGSEVRQAGLAIIFELDGPRFAIDWSITELNQKPGELIPMLRKDRQRIPNRNCSPVRNYVSRGMNTRLPRARNTNSSLILDAASKSRWICFEPEADNQSSNSVWGARTHAAESLLAETPLC
jgi:hypothetical protein